MWFTVVVCNRKTQRFEEIPKDTCRTALTSALQVCAEMREGDLWDAHSRNVFQTRVTCNIVPYSLPWSRLQLLHSVLTSAIRLIRGLKRCFDHIPLVLIDPHWLPYPQTHLIIL